MNQLGKTLESILKNSGADLVGFADLSQIEHVPFKTGVILAVAQPVIGTAEETQHYYIRQRLDESMQKGTSYLIDNGYEVFLQGRDGNRVLPHKTIATLAGLGWIGKNCLLITPEFGAGVRLASFFTNAPLPCAEPILESKCGDCTACVDACLGKALKGALWKAGMEQKELLDVEACRKMRDQVWSKWTGSYEFSENCISACPYTPK